MVLEQTTHSSPAMARRTRLAMVLGALVSVALMSCISDAPAPSAPVDIDPGQDGATPTDAGEVEASAPGTSTDAGTRSPTCDLSSNFENPVIVAGLKSNHDEGGAFLSSDERSIVFSRTTADLADGGVDRSSFDLFQARRASVTEPFTAVSALASVNSAYQDNRPSFTGDFKHLYFHAFPSNDSSDADLFVATRDDPGAEFGAPQRLAISTSKATDAHPFVLSSGKVLYFTSTRENNGAGGVYRIYRSETEDTGEFLPATLVLSLPEGAVSPVVSEDELTIYFARASAETNSGDSDIYIARRSSLGDGFGAATRLTINSDHDDYPQWISTDGCRLYFTSAREGDHIQRDLWMAERRAVTD